MTTTRGDMHYWSVWHEGKDFRAYRDVNPRFCSEFGFQSFTSMNVIETLHRAGGPQPVSPVMESTSATPAATPASSRR